MNEPWAEDVARSIREATQRDFTIEHINSCGGGCINDALLLQGREQTYFVKLNQADKLPMFVAEATGLNAIEATGTIRVPKVITHGKNATHAFLVLEAIRFARTPADWSEMGSKLAAMHYTQGTSFGWPSNNFIGVTPQMNRHYEDWATFFVEQRLRPQFRLARSQGHPIRHSEQMLLAATKLLRHHLPKPSLLHGDLWSGNAAYDDEGQPVVFDPACYYGDREADLAFSEMFGGFPDSFYRAYNEAWPIPEGYKLRKKLYNLYHVVNHANIFGGGYHQQASELVKFLLANIRHQDTSRLS